MSEAASGVYMARHGQTPYNAEGRFQGQGAVPLNDTGRAQALELAQRTDGYGFVRLWCSPLRRARETADIVAARLGLEPREDPRLMETETGEWTDRSFAEISSVAPDAFAAFVAGEADFAFPGGESFAEQSVRVAAALEDIERTELPALVVCHRQVIRLAIRQRGQALSANEHVDNGALIALPSR
ncbi:MAG TPA: histidine phosphatase family protein [Solirubrobacteraceae bacterium]|jgi:probable phosphoglycerate mutase